MNVGNVSRRQILTFFPSGRTRGKDKVRKITWNSSGSPADTDVYIIINRDHGVLYTRNWMSVNSRVPFWLCKRKEKSRIPSRFQVKTRERLIQNRWWTGSEIQVVYDDDEIKPRKGTKDADFRWEEEEIGKQRMGEMSSWWESPETAVERWSRRN